MPPKKKSPRNPFFFFMQDWKQNQIKKGNQVPGPLNLLAEAATPDWQTLPEAEKEYYKEKARLAKEEDKVNLHNKFTTQGRSYAEVYAEEKEVDDFNAQMNKEINDTISSISQTREGLISKRFYFIHANHYCYWQPEGIYIPCEVAIAEYSIEHGVIDTLHLFPTVIATKNGMLPVGYLFEAQQIAEKTHYVPLPRMEGAEDYETITARLCSFLQRSGTSKIPPLYTQENNVNCNNSMSTVKDFLKNCERYCEEKFQTYNLAVLFYQLRNACADLAAREGIDQDAIGFPTPSLAQIELDRDIFHYTKGISCLYHEELSLTKPDLQVSQFCSKSTVQRWCYLISDYCCKDVGIVLKPGKHCPLDANVSYLADTNKSIECDSAGRRKNAALDAPPPAVNRWKSGPPNAAHEQSDYAVDDFSALDGCRLPKTRGRGERLLAAINKVKLDAKEDFPALGAGRGRGRL